MRSRRKALVLVAALAAQLGAVAVLAGSAHAATGPADDRQRTSPTSWWTYTGLTATQLSAKLSGNSARLTSLQVDNGSTPTFTAVMVRNSGAYASGYWWYYGQTQAQVSSLLTTNHARLISASPYATGSGTRYAAVMVPNTGSNAKSWWWYIGSTSFLSGQLSAHHARMLEVSPMPGSSSSYLGIMVDNTGSNASSWWWYVHASVASMSSKLSANHAHLVDLSRNTDGTLNGVMYANGPGTRWYWYVNSSPSAAVTRALQQGERIVDATSYTVSGTKYYAVVETRNTDALSERLWNLIGPTVDSGRYGFYLKQVGGSTLAGLQQSTQYEPASALKVLYHAKSIHEESLGHAHDTDSVTYHYDPANAANQGICPDSFATTATTNLKNADQQMMWNSDNRMTRGILEKYGKPAMTSYAATLGLTSTAINHNIGCPTSSTHNRTTLVDLGRVYEAFQNGHVTTSSTWKAQFRSRMLNESNYGGFRNSICPVVSQEAVKLGKSASVATTFCNAMTWIAKGGSYQYGGALPYQVSWDGLSMTQVPYRSNGASAPRSFVFGEYVDGTTINSQAEANAINTARGKEYQEAMRPYIHAALMTW